MKKSILTLACALIAPLAFAQTSSTSTTETTKTKTNPLTGNTKTTTETTTTSTDGTVTTFTPGQTIVVRREGVTDPISYTLGKTVRFVNRAGHEIKENVIRPGARVHVYYDSEGDAHVVNRVVVDDD